MKRNIVDVIIAFSVFCLLLLGFIWTKTPQTESETFSPPSWGAGRDQEAAQEATDQPDQVIPSSETKTEAESETDLDPDPVETESEIVSVIPDLGFRYLDVPLDHGLQDYVYQVCDQDGVPFELVMAVIFVESGFDQDAISSTGDYGLMQISHINHGWLSSELGLNDFLDPYQNIAAGVHILADKINESGGDLTQALMRYNRGNSVAMAQMRDGIFSTDYTEKVLSKYYEYITEG